MSVGSIVLKHVNSLEDLDVIMDSKLTSKNILTILHLNTPELLVIFESSRTTLITV